MRSNRTPALLTGLAAAAALAGCDTRATASSTGDVIPARLSQAYETCSSTAQCADELRCFDQTCVSAARSTLGDYLAARAGTQASVEAAIADLAEAQATYQAEQVAIPADLDCAYGRALARAEGKQDKLELAARLLHRCLVAVPVGSRLRRDAIAALVGLDAAGLDPKQIAKTAPADLYLTRAPELPSTDQLKINVTTEPVVSNKSLPLVVERVTAPEQRAALMACWQAHHDNAALTVKLPLKVSYKPSEFDDEPGQYRVAMDAPTEPGAACVYGAVAPAITATKGLRDKFDTTLVVSIK
ncbi:MAG: hypothetical protein R3B06_17410 [Kofleriaceae bacterium]